LSETDTMKASTLFAMTIAVLLALGVAVGAKQLGLFDRGVKLESKSEPPKILVAKSNLFEGITITPAMVEVRPVRTEQELAHYRSNADKSLPANELAASNRIPLRNIEAGKPILKDDLQDLAIPEASRCGCGPACGPSTWACPRSGPP